MTWIDKDTEKALRKEIPLAREELAQIHREAVRRLRRDNLFRALMIPLFILPIAVIVLTRLALPWTRGSSGLHLVGFAVAVALVVVAMLAFYRLLRPHYHHHLRRVVRRRGHEMCLGCGYWLEELGGDIDHCPECGAKRTPLAGQSSLAPEEDAGKGRERTG